MSASKLNKKCNLTIGKKHTINSGNYSSIQPNISLTINDVPFSKIVEVKEAINVIIDNMFIDQVKGYLNEMDDIQRSRIEDLYADLDEDEIRQEIEDAIDTINRI